MDEVTLHPFTLYFSDEDAQWIRERARVERRELEGTILKALEGTEMSQPIQGTVEHTWESAAYDVTKEEVLYALEDAYYQRQNWMELVRKVLVKAGRRSS